MMQDVNGRVGSMSREVCAMPHESCLTRKHLCAFLYCVAPVVTAERLFAQAAIATVRFDKVKCQACSRRTDCKLQEILRAQSYPMQCPDSSNARVDDDARCTATISMSSEDRKTLKHGELDIFFCKAYLRHCHATRNCPGLEDLEAFGCLWLVSFAMLP